MTDTISPTKPGTINPKVTHTRIKYRRAGLVAGAAGVPCPTPSLYPGHSTT